MAMLAGASAASDTIALSLRVLQMNLCDSGLAPCYTGRSVPEAARVIRAERPDVVTLNEVCQSDVSVLERTLSDANHGSVVASAFEAAVDRRTRAPFRCRNGQQYGIGLLTRVRPLDRGYRANGDVYPIQDTRDPEERVWLCIHNLADFYACTTHLASTNPTVALAQCSYLFDQVIPAARRKGGEDPLVLAGDLNLGSGRSPDVRLCVPRGDHHTDDGGTQHVVATTDLTVRSSGAISVQGTTDHPGLLVDLAISPHS
jgi:endonuclease/exonuclease/phosphatase family metal-dependent hydrolase